MLKNGSRLLFHHFFILMHPTSSFLLILIFWPIYLLFNHISTYVDSFQTIPNQLKITQNQFETIVNQPQIMSNQLDHLATYQTSSVNHLLVDFRHCCIYQCLIITSKLSNLTFSVIMSFDTRSTYHFNILLLTLLNPSMFDHNINQST